MSGMIHWHREAPRGRPRPGWPPCIRS